MLSQPPTLQGDFCSIRLKLPSVILYRLQPSRKNNETPIGKHPTTNSRRPPKRLELRGLVGNCHRSTPALFRILLKGQPVSTTWAIKVQCPYGHCARWDLTHIFIIGLTTFSMKFEVNSDYVESKSKQSLYKDVSSNTDAAPKERASEIFEKVNLRIYCSTCTLDITRATQICTKLGSYCVGCFSNLEDFPDEYIVRSSLKRSLTNTNWDLMDELILVSAFQQWGYSNWRQIQEFMNYNQSPFSLEEIKQHYQEFHYFQPDHLIPIPRDIPKALPHTPYSQITLRNYEEITLKDISLRRTDSKGEKKSNSQRNIGHQSQGQRGLKPFSMIEVTTHSSDIRSLSTYMKTESTVLGYNAKRGEFEACYYDVEAERMLDDLEFYDNDTPEEFALKIEIIQQYNRRLDERAKRKNFVLDYKLLDSHCQIPQSQEEQKAALIFQPFMRFTANHQEYQDMVDAFSTIEKEQSFITNLMQVRRKVSQEATLASAFRFLTKKRKKSILSWEQRFGKKFEDKRRRKVFVRQTLQDGQVLLQEEDQHQEVCPLAVAQIENLRGKGEQAESVSGIRIVDLESCVRPKEAVWGVKLKRSSQSKE